MFDKANPLSKAEARALAKAFREAGNGAENFLAALLKAKSENGGRIAGEPLWHQIAGEMAALEAAPLPLGRRLKLALSARVISAIAALYFVKMRLP